MIEVAYGVLDEATAEAALLAALRRITDDFDESPARMHAVLGPPGGIRWFAFACTLFERGHVLAEDHFAESLDHLPVLLVAARSEDGPPTRFDIRGQAAWLTLVRHGGAIAVVRGTLPAAAAREGDVDEIALSALGLPMVRPFDALRSPTHEVILRDDHSRPPELAITPFAGSVLPIGVRPTFSAADGALRFAYTPRAIDPADDTALAAKLDRVSVDVEAMYGQTLDGAEHRLAYELASHGTPIVGHLVAMLEKSRGPRSSRLCLLALGSVGALGGAAAPEVILPWVTRGISLRDAAFAALARIGEPARPALVAGLDAGKAAIHEAAAALLSLLDDARFAPIRAARAARDTVTTATRDALRVPPKYDFEYRGLLHALPPDQLAGGIGVAMRAMVDDGRPRCATAALTAQSPDAIWAFALHLIETPLDELGLRRTALEAASKLFGAVLGPVADVLMQFPPLAEDRAIQAYAAGKEPPSVADVRQARSAAKPKAPTSKPKAAASSTKAAASTPKAAASKPKAATSNPKAATSNPKAARSKPKAATSKPKPTTGKPKPTKKR